MASRPRVCSSRPIRRARKPARLAATSPKTRAVRTASSMASPPITSWRSNWCFQTASDGYGGLDLTAAVVGSEGMFGIVTRALVKLTPIPAATTVMLAAFGSLDDASHAVTSMIAAGNLPASLEMMDNLTIQAVEPAYHAGYPMDAGAVLLIESDGNAAEVAESVEEIAILCGEAGATEVRHAI